MAEALVDAVMGCKAWSPDGNRLLSQVVSISDDHTSGALSSPFTWSQRRRLALEALTLVNSTFPSTPRHLMRHITTYLALAVLLAGCDSPTQPVSAGFNTSQPALIKAHVGEVVREAISDVIEVPCIGETLTLTGEVLHVFNGAGQGAASGNFTNYTDFFKISGTAVGESGTQYVFSEINHYTFASPSPDAIQVSFTHREGAEVVSKGGEINFVALLIFHITVLPDGSFIVTTDFDRGECRG